MFKRNAMKRSNLWSKASCLELRFKLGFQFIAGYLGSKCEIHKDNTLIIVAILYRNVNYAWIIIH